MTSKEHSLCFISHSIEETINFGKKIGESLKAGDIIAMEGTLGAGKTTISKGIALGLDISEDITSPTFTLVCEYQGRLPLYHMDVYRLEGAEDFYSLGAEDMLYGKGVCLIEWSEKIKSELPDSCITLKIELCNDGTRKITLDNWKYE